MKEMLNYFYSAIIHFWDEILSLIAIGVAIASYIRAGRYQRFEYAPRLELVDNLSLRAGIKYRAEIENKGIKPVKIKTIFLESGSRQDPKKRIHHVVKGPFYLSPGEPRKIEFERSQSDLERIKQECQARECFFFLRVVYLTATGNVVEVTRDLGGYDEGGDKMITLHIGRTLT